MDALRKDDIAGVLKVPAGFSEQAKAGVDAQLTLITDSTSANGQSLYQLLRVPISQLMSAVEVARINVDLHRITSYNVCYTKLLRITVAWAGRSEIVRLPKS